MQFTVVQQSKALRSISYMYIRPPLRQTMGKSSKVYKASLARLTYEEIRTVLVQIKGILNSKPRTPLSSDSSDLSVLASFHFLIGLALTEIHHLQELTATSCIYQSSMLNNYVLQRIYFTATNQNQMEGITWTTRKRHADRQQGRRPLARWILGRIIKAANWY